MTDERPIVGDKDDYLVWIQQANEAAKEALSELEHCVRVARDLGATWREIGAAQGLSKQAMQQKYGQKEPPEAGIEQDTAF
jgi:dihydroxyacetone kinase